MRLVRYGVAYPVAQLVAVCPQCALVYLYLRSRFQGSRLSVNPCCNLVLRIFGLRLLRLAFSQFPHNFGLLFSRN